MSSWIQMLLGVAGAVATLYAAVRIVEPILKKTIGRSYMAYKRLSRLAAHVHVDHFASVLGPPISSKVWVNNGEPTNWSERVWVDPRYHVQAICDPGTASSESTLSRQDRSGSAPRCHSRTMAIILTHPILR